MKRVRLNLTRGISNLVDGIAADTQTADVDLLETADNVDLDNDFNARVRKGRTLKLAATTPHSFQVNPKDDSVAWFIEQAVLKRFNADFTATTLATMSNDQPLIYEPINDELVVTNGEDIGWLTAEEFVPFAPTLGQFEAAMPAGQFLAFCLGCLIVASGNTLYVSKPWNIEVRDTRFSEFPLDGHIRMVGSVEDGIWVSTEKHVGFLAGKGSDEWEYKDRTNKVPTEGCFGTGYVIENNSPVKRVFWAADGFYEGRAGGALTNLSDGMVRLPSGSGGMCISREENGISQLIALIRNPASGNIAADDNLDVNTLYR